MLFHFDSMDSRWVQKADRSQKTGSQFTCRHRLSKHWRTSELPFTTQCKTRLEVPKQSRMQTESWAPLWLRASKAPDFCHQILQTSMIISNNAIAENHICFQTLSSFTFPHMLWKKANVSKAMFNRHSTLITTLRRLSQLQLSNSPRPNCKLKAWKQNWVLQLK